jgi:hypothetical protein
MVNAVDGLGHTLSVAEVRAANAGSQVQVGERRPGDVLFGVYSGLIHVPAPGAD